MVGKRPTKNKKQKKQTKTKTKKQTNIFFKIKK
jgi:hypothetical protein